MLQVHASEVQGSAHVRTMAWTAVLLFVVVEGATRLFDLYRRVPSVDIPIHFLSGVAVTAVLLLVFSRTGRALAARWSIWGNGVVALTWEALEAIDEVVTPDPPHLQDVFWWDGFGDVGAALAGGLALLWLVRRVGGP